MTIYSCSNPVRHPVMHARQQHHQPPKAWREKMLANDPNVDQSWWRIVGLCGLDHDEYHTLLNAYVHLKGVMPESELKTYSKYIRVLVQEAWNHRIPGDDKMPYTITHSSLQ